MEHLEKCLVCGALASGARAVYKRQHDTLVRCQQCGLLYANPLQTPEELVELYHREYGTQDNALGNMLGEGGHEVNRVLYRTVVDDLLRRYPRLVPAGGQPQRVLDYGCGPGFFLAECKSRGFETTGVEFAELAARFGRERLGLEIMLDPDTALQQLPNEHYSLVTAWAVLEHTRRPREVLARLVAKLAPGGVLCLTIPNLRCWRYLLERGRWFNITEPTHLFFFDDRGLRRLLGELGLVNIVRPVFWGGRPGFGFAANLAQYLVRLADMGADHRVYAERKS